MMRCEVTYGIKALNVLDMFAHDQLEFIWNIPTKRPASTWSRNERHTEGFAAFEG